MSESLDIHLPSDVVYVSGTVNGDVTTWTLTAPDVWSTVVPKSPDGRYLIEITTYNSIGTPTSFTLVVFRMDDHLPFKTDWTIDDYYNYWDFDRVDANMQYIADYLNSISYVVQINNVVPIRDYSTVEYIAGANRIESNLQAIINGFVTPAGFQPGKTWARRMGFDYTDANRWEQNQALILAAAIAIYQSFRYCGTFDSGEEFLP